MSILVNGSPTDEFCLVIGVRQAPFFVYLGSIRFKCHGEWSKDNAKSLMCILKCFEEVSGRGDSSKKEDHYGLRLLRVSTVIVVDLVMLGGVVGNGSNIGFWVDRWVGDMRLCERFPRLYHLDRRKEGRVAKKGKWVDNRTDGDGHYKMVENYGKSLVEDSVGENSTYGEWRARNLME
ncbi:hypothetical protein Tco_0978182 [Tanacetum coccineum]|uniref:Uncharacterized protein n=1 Tax=Tanacetum coccineum TaxID=301880 RepID=A0ABQ5EMB0_9ASTR